jgi:uncharacterized protein (DUF1810 family)
MTSRDPFNLQRFVDAQNPVFEEVRRELQEGRKRSHWMWFIFPQLKGLGSSQTAVYFGIASRTEAEMYLQHSILGPRLHECTRLVNHVDGRSIEEIFGYADDLKFRSSMTLFAAAQPENPDPEHRVFQEALDKYFAGAPEPQTIERL